MLSSIKSCSYESIVISDHSPVTMELWLQVRRPIQCNWRFNTSLLSDETFVDFISTQIDFFIETNQLPDTDILILWETLKAYIRGLNRSRSRRYNELINLIHVVD